MKNDSHFASAISNTDFPESEKISGKAIQCSILDLIQRDYPDFKTDQYISLSELNLYREKYITEYLQKEIGELSEMEKAVIGSLNSEKLLASSLEDKDPEDYTFGQKVADSVASFGGSWTFIILFGVFILLWICGNIYILANKGFDPYPFILLNLILSCLAALQAPVIMMSQNRQEVKDRERARQDYMINLKSEMEIRTLHEKIDHLIMHQQKELIEIQKVQIEMMNDILAKIKKGS